MSPSGWSVELIQPSNFACRVRVADRLVYRVTTGCSTSDHPGGGEHAQRFILPSQDQLRLATLVRAVCRGSARMCFSSGRPLGTWAAIGEEAPERLGRRDDYPFADLEGAHRPHGIKANRGAGARETAKNASTVCRTVIVQGSAV